MKLKPNDNGSIGIDGQDDDISFINILRASFIIHSPTLRGLVASNNGIVPTLDICMTSETDPLLTACIFTLAIQFRFPWLATGPTPIAPSDAMTAFFKAQNGPTLILPKDFPFTKVTAKNNGTPLATVDLASTKRPNKTAKKVSKVSKKTTKKAVRRR